MFCSKCGANLPNGTQSCPNCGTPVQNPTQNLNQQAYVPAPNYQQQYNNRQTTFNQFSSHVIEPRNFWLSLLFSFLTCGIYLYYWIYAMTEDVNALSNEPDATSGGMVILLSFVTCGFYIYYWMYKQGERIDNAKRMRGMATDGNTAVLYLLLMIFGAGIVSYCLMQNEINKMVA